jgi:quercetin dioxygenase-like cupin family protein
MRTTSFILAALLLAAPASALAADEHKIVPADSLAWSEAPPMLPAGAQVAVLYGSPKEEGLFVMRLKFPAGYHVPPHFHPVTEAVTVISGALALGMGETADRSKAQALPAGSFFALPADMAHYAFADEETVVQLSTNGPWGLTYVNAADDPRNASQ